MKQDRDMSIAVLILSEKTEIPADIINTAKQVGKVFLLHPPKINPTNLSGIKRIPLQDTVPKVLNWVVENCETEFLLIAKDNVCLEEKLFRLIETVPSDAVSIYGDYFEVSNGIRTFRQSYQGPEDITERAELGPVMIYRVSALKKISGWKESLKYAYDYDLRLRLAELGLLFRIAQPICTVFNEPVGDIGKHKLFFPGKGKYGGFSYLFMSPEEEREIEVVFLKCLKRRGAYLTGEAPPMKAEPLKSPALSIITPVYNREKYIGQTIESVLAGKFPDFEYIIVDNGSSDNTVKVIEKYTADKRIKLICNPVNRIALSLNIGLRAAQGKYIAQLDSDDLFTPDTLNSTVEFMEDTNCALGISYYSLIDAEGNDLPEFGVIKHLEYGRNNILRVDGAGAVRVWRKSAMLEFGGFDEKKLCDYGEDYDLVLKVGEKYRVDRVHEVLYKYRRHPDNSDAKRDPLFKLRNKNLARVRAICRRIKINNENN